MGAAVCCNRKRAVQVSDLSAASAPQERELKTGKADDEAPLIQKDGDSEKGDELTPANCGLMCGCFCYVLAILAIINVIRWSTWPSCDGASVKWNTVLPSQTAMQFRREWFSWTSKVDVYNVSRLSGEADDITLHKELTTLGYWTDLNAMIARRFSFIGHEQDTALVEGRPPFGLYFGMKYDLWRCGGDESDTFHVVQDYWATPFWQFWNKPKIFDIFKGTEKIAKSYSQTNDLLLTSAFSEKEIKVTDLEDKTLATIKQESQVEAGWQDRRFFTENLRPDIVPNELVAFLGAVWELNEVKEKSESDSSHTSTLLSRRRKR